MNRQVTTNRVSMSFRGDLRRCYSRRSNGTMRSTSFDDEPSDEQPQLIICWTDGRRCWGQAFAKLLDIQGVRRGQGVRNDRSLRVILVESATDPPKAASIVAAKLRSKTTRLMEPCSRLAVKRGRRPRRRSTRGVHHETYKFTRSSRADVMCLSLVHPGNGASRRY